MKRLITVMFILSLFMSLTANAVGTYPINYRNVANPRSLTDLLTNRIGGIESDLSLLPGTGSVGTGQVFYVDSGVGDDTYTGKRLATATATLDAAVALCTANRGDIIYVMQGHNEALTGADDVDLDVAGITVIGLGRGSLKPTFDYDNAAGEFVIGAANVTVSNLRFRVSENAVTKAIDIETAGNYATIQGCEFGYAETATNEFATGIIVGANDVSVLDCYMSAGGQAAVSAVSVPAAQDHLVLKGNWFFGDYSTAVFSGVGVVTESVIANNILFNGTMGGDGELNSEPAIEVADGSSGFVLDNRIVSDVATGLLMRVADDMVFMNNFISDTDGDEFSGTTEDTAASITAHADG